MRCTGVGTNITSPFARAHVPRPRTQRSSFTGYPEVPARPIVNANKAGQHVMQTTRRSEDRGCAEFGWVSSQYTFCFGDYYDPRFMGFGALLAINEHMRP
jgi:hypothetical protein